MEVLIELAPALVLIAGASVLGIAIGQTLWNAHLRAQARRDRDARNTIALERIANELQSLRIELRMTDDAVFQTWHRVQDMAAVTPPAPRWTVPNN